MQLFQTGEERKTLHLFSYLSETDLTGSGRENTCISCPHFRSFQKKNFLVDMDGLQGYPKQAVRENSVKQNLEMP